jgi:transposase
MSPASQSGPDDGALAAAIAVRDEIIAALQAVLAKPQELNARALARIAELERRLGLNSGNSGKPPSSDGLGKPPRQRTQSRRESSGKKRGGQKGHKGEMLRRVKNPDATVNHFPQTCSGCGGALEAATTADFIGRQVFDLPEPRPLFVTEHRAHQCGCASCGAQTRAAFSEGVAAPVQYGPRIIGFLLYLLHYQMLPEKRLAALMADLFGVSLACSTIANISRACAQRFAPFACHVTNRAREREVSLSPRHIALIERCYDAIVAKGIAAHDALPPLIAPAKRRGRPKRRVGHTSSCVCATSSQARCASSPIQPCPSPTTSPSRTRA